MSRGGQKFADTRVEVVFFFQTPLITVSTKIHLPLWPEQISDGFSELGTTTMYLCASAPRTVEQALPSSRTNSATNGDGDAMVYS